MKKSLSLIALVLPLQLLANTIFVPFTNFGANPGELSAHVMNVEQPEGIAIVLRGCAQQGTEFAKLSGFAEQAQSANIALLVPQQSKANNATACFNWFSPQDHNKQGGELESIMNMATAYQASLDVAPLFIVGLSAGGAMASAILSVYPDKFSAGAIIAGVPFPCADNLVKAISCMKSGSNQSDAELAKAINKSSIGANHSPDVMIIAGTKDDIVSPVNAKQLAGQWQKYTNATLLAGQTQSKGYTSSKWRGNDNEIELIEVNGIGHGLPVLDNRKSYSPFYLPSKFDSASYILNKFKSNLKTKR